jgi:dipeptidyl aminopeptidase/acylaminoacyl peptidase
MKNVRLVLLVAVIFIWPPLRSHASEEVVSLEVLLSAPLYSSIIAAPDGSRFAWVENRRGVRNVWVASGEPLAALPITRFNEDDGQDISQLSFSRDGGVLAFVRGGPPSFDGIPPDPASTPSGAKVEIWLWRAGSDAAAFGGGTAPDLTGDGEQVAFVREGKIFISSTRQPEKAAAAVAARGKLRSPRWSPGGDKVAFVSERGDHAILGVYRVDAKSVVWIAPGFGSDRAPAWSPDGARIAFLRMPSDPVKPTVEWEPPGRFEIWVAEAETGNAHPAFRSADRTAGHAQDAELRPVQWAAEDSLVFPWEHDNWARLYAVPAKGGEATPLSPSGCEARMPRLGANGSRLYYVANCDDVDRSHVWSVQVPRGEPRVLTRGEGVESSLAAGIRQVVLIATTARQPGAPVALDLETGALRPLVPKAPDWPATSLVDPEPVTVRARDGVEIHAQLFRTSDARGRRPAVIFVHGGPVRQMLLGWPTYEPGGYYQRAYAMNQHLASTGHVVLSVNFRGGTGYGRAFRLAARRGPQGASEYQDVVAVARYLRGRPDVDPSRIAIWGGSYGGYLTALALARDPDLFAAGVDIHGVHDWSAYLRTEEPDRAWDAADLRLAFASSPIFALGRWRAPILIVHGDHDPAVRFSQSLDLAQRLQALPHPPDVETLLVPDEVHAFLRYSSWLTVLGRTSQFFDRRLKGAARAAAER